MTEENKGVSPFSPNDEDGDDDNFAANLEERFQRGSQPRDSLYVKSKSQ